MDMKILGMRKELGITPLLLDYYQYNHKKLIFQEFSPKLLINFDFQPVQH
jgi:hypothetical protein